MLTCSICGKKDKSTKKYTEYDVNSVKKTRNLCNICLQLRQLTINAELFDIMGPEEFKKELDSIYKELTRELKRRIDIDKAYKKRSERKHTDVLPINTYDVD